LHSSRWLHRGAAPPRFQPWQEIWQCNDIRVTVTAPDPFSIEYDLGGTIWGGSRFTRIRGGGPSPMTTELQDLFAIAAENAATVFRKTGSFAPNVARQRNEERLNRRPPLGTPPRAEITWPMAAAKGQLGRRRQRRPTCLGAVRGHMPKSAASQQAVPQWYPTIRTLLRGSPSSANLVDRLHL